VDLLNIVPVEAVEHVQNSDDTYHDEVRLPSKELLMVLMLFLAEERLVLNSWVPKPLTPRV